MVSTVPSCVPPATETPKDSTNATAWLAGQMLRIPGSRRERKRLLRRFPGLINEVARLLAVRDNRGVDSSFVTRVWNGKSTSARVTKVLLEEMNRRVHAASEPLVSACHPE